MKKIIFKLAFLIFCIQKSFAQTVLPCDIKLGGNTFGDYENIIAYKEQVVFSIGKNISNNSIIVNFDLFSSEGKKEATIINGKVISGDATLYTIISSEKEYIFTENATKKNICFIKNISNGKSSKCELDVSFDMYMPNGRVLKISPETTSINFMNQSVGSTTGGIPVIYGVE